MVYDFSVITTTDECDELEAQLQTELDAVNYRLQGRILRREKNSDKAVNLKVDEQSLLNEQQMLDNFLPTLQAGTPQHEEMSDRKTTVDYRLFKVRDQMERFGPVAQLMLDSNIDQLSRNQTSLQDMIAQVQAHRLTL